MQKDFGSWLARRLSELEILPRELSKKAGVSESAVSLLINNRRKPTVNTLSKISPFLNVSLDEILVQAGFVPESIPVHYSQIPIVGEAQAGRIHSNTSLGESSGALLVNAKAIVVRGSSMQPLANDGDVIIFNPDIPVRSGDLVYIKLNSHGAFFKRYIDLRFDTYKNYSKDFYKFGKKQSLKLNPIMLYSVNSNDFEPIIARHNDIDFMYKVVAVRFR